MTRTPLRLLVLAVTSVLAVLVLTVPAQAAAAPYCGITWGSLPKQGATTGPVPGAMLSNVRAGRQGCYDRLVLDIRDTTEVGSWRVEYVGRVTEDPSGRAVPLRGGALLQVVVGASDHTDPGTPSYTPANRRELVDVAGFSTFRQVAWAGSFEGVTSVGLGVRARLPFRVLTLSGPPGSGSGIRVVIDVARRW
jgi:hypothetical protein